jgi:superfamily II DNA or RNA helicase
VKPIRVLVDNRARVPAADLDEAEAKALRELFTHGNSKFWKTRALGYSTRGIPPQIVTLESRAGWLEAPRGGILKIRAFAEERGRKLLVCDERTEGSLPREDWPAPLVAPRDYQKLAIEAILARQSGIVRAPTAAGKTYAAILAAQRIGLPACFTVWESGLFDQWVANFERALGIGERDVGIIRGKERRLRTVTIAMQQTLGKLSRGDEVFWAFGTVIADEAQKTPAVSMRAAIDPFLAKYRVGVSADIRRKDGMEAMTNELFGEIIHEIDPASLEAKGSVLPIDVLVYQTRFRADWYDPMARAKEDAEGGEERDGDFGRLLDEIGADEERNDLAARLAAEAVGSVFVMVRRREHGLKLDQLVTALGARSGIMFGGADYARVYDETRALLESGEVKVAVGTIQSIGQGIDVPRVHDVVLAAPCASNEQLFNQARGRACRPWGGEKVGRVHYLLDDAVFPGHLKNLDRWYPGRVYVVRPDGSRESAREWMRANKPARGDDHGGLFR